MCGVFVVVFGFVFNQRASKQSLFKFLFYVYGYFACMWAHHVYVVPKDARRGHQILWNWRYRGWLLVAM